MKYSDWQDRELYDELFEIICEVVCVKHKTIRIGEDDYHYELVKSKFLKLNSSHLNYANDIIQFTLELCHWLHEEYHNQDYEHPGVYGDNAL